MIEFHIKTQFLYYFNSVFSGVMSEIAFSSMFTDKDVHEKDKGDGEKATFIHNSIEVNSDRSRVMSEKENFAAVFQIHMQDLANFSINTVSDSGEKANYVSGNCSVNSDIVDDAIKNHTYFRIQW